LRLSHTVVQIHGKERLEGVTIAKVDDKGRPIADTFELVECDTLLLSVGLIPENELSKAASIRIDAATSGPFVNEAAETSEKGIFACGNVVYVHDLVDHVTEEGYRAGRSAAEYILRDTRPEPGENMQKTPGVKEITGAKPDTAEIVQIKPGYGIRCVIPQYIQKNCEQGEIQLFFRAADIFENVQLEVKSTDKVVYSARKKKLAPGEMDSIRLTKKMLDDAGSGELLVNLKII
jgi:hypothetical protein